ncbi:MAG: polysaccharide deacetylase family protein [Proteobacteria bacterium]|nr:polysaccharide deacetylase family protein [Pseudomonadota bacterium]
MADRWKPTAAIQVSFALHAAALAVVIARPHLWPWALGAIVADHLVLTAAGLWPRSKLLGPNWTHLPANAAIHGSVAITIDDGPDPVVTPQVLDLLDQHSAKATFFCIGELVEQHAALARDIVSRGHTIENHSQHHLHRFSVLGPSGIKAEITRAQDTIEAVTGQRPHFFRAPAGLRSPFLEPVLARLGLRLASWTRRGFDTVNPDPAVVFKRLTMGLRSGDILLLHDGHAARTPAGSPVILEVLPQVLQAVSAARLTPVTLRSALT